jgi:5-methylcytosine-specific restriction endonuclease McrA
MCSGCGEVKPLDQFYRDRSRPSGRQSRCKECERKRMRTQYMKNRERDRELYRDRSYRWYWQNRDKAIAKVLRWKTNNPEALKALKRRYKALKRGAIGYTTAKQLRARIDYYGGRCWMCGDLADTIDHVIPISRGGSNWPANQRPACVSCNSSKQAKLPAEL